MVVVCCYLSGVGCRVLTGDCRVSVIDSRCRLSLTFSLVGATLMSDRLKRMRGGGEDAGSYLVCAWILNKRYRKII
jgi:hypothetical protein